MKKIDKAYRLLVFGFLFCLPLVSMGQIKINGTVTDSTSAPIIGASVLVKGSTTGTKTNGNGGFTIEASPGQTLVFSSVGYDSLAVLVNNADIPINISLRESSSLLSDVVIVGYGTQKKINLSGAVSQVSGQVLEDRPITTLGAGLQGLIPSLQVSTGNSPGQGSNFNVRGFTSINGGGPLILVDGVVQDPNLLNPNDVASVTVLKDAAAAAIYGGRAAFGVVLITTKNGKRNQKPTLNLTSSVSSSRVTLLPKYMNSLDYINYMDTASINAGAGPFFSQRIRDGVEAYFNDPVNNQPVIYDPAIDKGYYQYVGNTDWAEELYRPGIMQQHNLSLSGGSNDVSYYVSYGLMYQRGSLAIIDDKFQRQNLNMSVNADVLKWLSFSGKVKYSYGEEKHPGGGYFGSNGAYNGQLNSDLRPIMPIYHPDGNYAGQGNFTNPFSIGQLSGGYGVKKNDLWLTGAAHLKPLKGLNVNMDYTFNPYANNIDFSTRKFREYHADGTYNYYTWTNPNLERQTNSNDYYYAFNTYADYSKTIGNRHNFKLLVGYNQEQKFSKSFNAERKELIINDEPYLNLATGAMTVGQGTSSWAVQGIFGRLNYDYDNKYFLELDARRDGSSRFPVGNRTAMLPSGSAAWRVSQEGFWQNSSLSDIIPELKLRGSYGVLGNQSVNGDFPYLSTFGVNTALGYIFGNSSALAVSVSPGGLVRPDFTWEKVYQWNAGLDAEFFKSRLEASVDIYTRSTKGMLVNGTPAPAVLGTGVPRVNSGNAKTAGYDITLRWHDNIGANISYHADVVFSDAIATITKFDNNSLMLLSDRYVGQENGEIWGYESDGLFHSADEVSNHADQSALFGGQWSPGDVKYTDLNGDGKITEGSNTVDDSGDRKIIGNSSPRYNYSLVTGLRWKTFDIDVILQGVGKRDWFPEGRFFGIGSEWDVPMRAASDFWSNANQDGYLPKPYVNGTHGNRATNSYYLQSAAYLRLKQVTLGYSLPELWAKKISASKLRVYVTGQNILTFTKLSKLYDPENLGFGYPVVANYSVGLNLTF